MRLALLCVALVAASFGTPADAQCLFDQFGTISNPNDASCRDARFEFTENDNSGNNIALGYPVPMPVDSLTSIAGFRSYASLHARHQDLMLTDANLSGSVVGQTLGGRDIWAYRIGDADDLTPSGLPESAMLINGGIHAREWQSPEAVTEVLEQLLETDDDDGLGRYLSEHVNAVILPVLNIDGFLQTQRFPSSVAATNQQPRDGRMRRKNLRNPSGGAPVDDDLASSEDQWFGVDLNRNSEHGFGLNNRSSTDPVSLVYRGSVFASEPETQALQAAATLAPAERLRFYSDVHSFSRVFFIVRTGNSRLDTITDRLAARVGAVTANRYIASASGVGSAIGTSADFFGIEHQIPSWTLEIEPRNGGEDYAGTGASHSGFILPDAEIERVRDEVASMMMLTYYRMAGPPTLIAAQITRRGDDSVVYRADWITDAASQARTLNVSSNEGLVENEGYRLWLAFDKPMRYSEDGVSISNYPGQAVAGFPDISFDGGPDADDLSIAVTGDASNWLAQPGAAPDGYRRYRFDALAVDFDVPALSEDLGLSLSVGATDLSLNPLDGDPSTTVDFVAGVWTGYENQFLEAGDGGGPDCRLGTFARATGSTAAAPAAVTCKAAAVAAPPPPPPPPPPAPVASGGSGGGGGGAVGPLLLLLALRRRRV